jgi:hypothetical protein
MQIPQLDVASGQIDRVHTALQRDVLAAHLQLELVDSRAAGRDDGPGRLDARAVFVLQSGADLWRDDWPARMRLDFAERKIASSEHVPGKLCVYSQPFRVQDGPIYRTGESPAVQREIAELKSSHVGRDSAVHAVLLDVPLNAQVERTLRVGERAQARSAPDLEAPRASVEIDGASRMNLKRYLGRHAGLVQRGFSVEAVASVSARDVDRRHVLAGDLRRLRGAVDVHDDLSVFAPDPDERVHVYPSFGCVRP